MFKLKLYIILFFSFWVSTLFAQTNETREILYQNGDAQNLQNKAADLATPVKIYEYMRNNAEYSLYHGARSNSINSFLSLRGNDVDLASTLIALYRSQGINARYVQGDIKISREQLANWLGVLNEELAINLLSDLGIQNVDDSDPENIVFQHVWVEVLVGKWMDGYTSIRSVLF